MAIQLLVKGEKVPSVKRNPRSHQQEAIAASKQYFLNDKNTRGKLIMPCGTGKSLTAYWITQTLASKATIIAVPSLALIKQSLEDWTKEILLSKTTVLPDWCCICSDESTGQLTDDFVTDTYSLGIPTTTNEDEITSFLKRKVPGGKIIFTTYQSADKLAQVSRRLKFKFDLAILDEAHKTVGAKDKTFSILLQEDKINISKRLFMTATERIVKGAEDEILSMDDEKVYGKVFYKLSFKKAIEDGIITDYKIVTVLVNDTEIQDLIKKNKYLTDQSKKVDEAEAQMLTTAIALKKAIKDYNLKHTVSFHKSINASKEFKSLYEKIDTTADNPTVFHISSKLNAGARSELLKDFKNTSKAIITNARCLTEGVDVPAIDCVLFADQKQSVVDIVQASGRALRQYTDKNTGVKKEFGYIIIPVVLKEGESLDDLTESSRFKTVTRIVTSLSTQDETIVEELKLIDAGKQKAGSGKIQVIGTVNKSIKLDLSSFSLKISTKIWERIGRINFLTYKEAKDYATKLNLKTNEDWVKYISTGKRPADIPAKPHVVYENKGWLSWPDFLGVKDGWDGVFMNFIEAKKFIHSLGLKSQNEWFKYKKHNNLPIDFPRSPNVVYKKEWINWSDFLGNDTQATRTAQYLPFNEVLKHVRGLKLKNNLEWFAYCKTGNKPSTIPTDLKKIYKNDGWVGWKDTLGTKLGWDGKYKSFKEARDFVQSLKLKGNKEWREYCNSGKKPNDIPSNADHIYKNSGWLSWADFLGSKDGWDGVFISYKEARIYARNLKLKSNKEWAAHSKTDAKPMNIPAGPSQTYKNKGWIDWKDWLGTDFLEYKEAKTYVNSLKLTGSNKKKVWKEYCKLKLKPDNIPVFPEIKYLNSGWISWEDWLGKTNNNE